jgi:hypothetical protein
MKRRWYAASCAATGLVLGHPSAALAHHSFAMFDNSRSLTLKANDLDEGSL